MSTTTPARGKRPFLDEFKEFREHVTGYWAILVGFSTVFPLSNALVGALWTPPDSAAAFNSLSTVASFAAIAIAYASRSSLRRWYDPQEELRRGFLLLRQRILLFFRRLPISGGFWAVLGLLLAIIYFGATVNLKRVVESPTRLSLRPWQVWLTDLGVLDGFLLFFYAFTFGSLSTGFTLLAMRDYVLQLPKEEAPGASAKTAEEVQQRFAPFLQKRFCREVQISLEQSLKEEAGLRFVENKFHMKMALESGPLPDEWRFTIFGDPKLGELFKQRKSSRQLYVVHRVSRDETNLMPLEADEQGWKILKYQSRVDPETESVFEAEYTYLSEIEDLYVFHLTRFAREVTIRLRKNSELEYSRPIVTGGLAPLQPPKKGVFSDEILVEDQGLIFPGWGCVLHWRPSAKDQLF